MQKNKVKYGLSNAHYAKLTEGADGDTYEPPVPWPGAVQLTLTPKGEVVPFIADNREYWTAVGNAGYDGTFECALVPESFRKDILGEVEDGNKILFERADANPAYFALLFEFEGDAHKVKHVFYRCSASRPNIEGAATVNKEVKPTTLTFQARPNRDNLVKGNTKSDTLAAAADAWYAAVPTFTQAVVPEV